MNKNLMQAVHLLGIYTSGRFYIRALAGRSKVRCRQHIMTTLVNGPVGREVPQKDCGLTALRSKFYEHVKPEGDCDAARESWFIKWCQSVGQGLTDEMYLDFVNNHITVESWAKHHGIDDLNRAKTMLDSYREIRDHVIGIR